MFLINNRLHFKFMAVDCLLLALYTYCIYTIKWQFYNPNTVWSVTSYWEIQHVLFSVSICLKYNQKKLHYITISNPCKNANFDIFDFDVSIYLEKEWHLWNTDGEYLQ